MSHMGIATPQCLGEILVRDSRPFEMSMRCVLIAAPRRAGGCEGAAIPQRYRSAVLSRITAEWPRSEKINLDLASKTIKAASQLLAPLTALLGGPRAQARDYGDLQSSCVATPRSA